MASGFIRVSFTREFTFPFVRGVWFTDLIRLVISSGFHSPVSSLSCFRDAWFILFIRSPSPVSSVSPVSAGPGLVVSSTSELGFPLPVSSLSRVPDVHSLVISSGFHSAVSSLSHVSQVHGLMVSLVSVTSEITFPSVRGAWFTGFFRVSFTREFTFPCSRRTQFSGFIRVSFSSDCTFPCFTGARFSGFFRVSFTREFTFPCVRGAWFCGFIVVSFSCECPFPSFRGAPFTGFLGVSSPVSTLAHVSQVHVLVISLGFHSAVSSLWCVQGAWLNVYFTVFFNREYTFTCFRGAQFTVSSGFHSPGNSLFRVSDVCGSLI